MNFKLADVPPFYLKYIHRVEGQELATSLVDSGDELYQQFKMISEEQAHYRYQRDKWSVKDILQHLIDAERVFCYRALRFSRGDATPLEGFEQNDYVVEALADERTLKSLIEEFQTLRMSTVQFFSSLKSDVLSRKGIASGGEMSVEMVGFIIAGHTSHHLSVIQERYLS